jgi:hypothetical protein
VLTRLRSLYPGGVRVLAVLVALLSGLVPLAAFAGEPGAAPPASIAIQLDFTGQFGDTAVAATGTGVVTDNGDLHFALALTQPQSRTIDEIVSGGVVYLSTDGGPYQSIDLSQAAAGALGVGGMLPGCATAGMAGPGFGNLGSLLGPGSAGSAGSLLQPAGTQVIDGVETEHLSGQIDLAQAAPALGQLLSGIAAACGLPATLSDLQGLQAGLAGATLKLDLYLQQPGNFPRQVNVALDIPAANVQFTLQENLTPQDIATPILPPQ